jgi:hypothetical protein
MNRRRFCFALTGAVGLLDGARPDHAECGEHDDWRIANIIYDNGKSLINHYRATTRRN